jgi:hypothetical protein
VRNIFQKNRALEIALGEPVRTRTPISIVPRRAIVARKEVVKEIRKYSRFTVFDDCSAFIKEGRSRSSGG